MNFVKCALGPTGGARAQSRGRGGAWTHMLVIEVRAVLQTGKPPYSPMPHPDLHGSVLVQSGCLRRTGSRARCRASHRPIPESHPSFTLVGREVPRSAVARGQRPSARGAGPLAVPPCAAARAQGRVETSSSSAPEAPLSIASVCLTWMKSRMTDEIITGERTSTRFFTCMCWSTLRAMGGGHGSGRARRLKHSATPRLQYLI